MNPVKRKDYMKFMSKSLRSIYKNKKKKRDRFYKE